MMRGNMKLSILVAIWLLLTVVLGPPRVCSFKVAEQHTSDYKRVIFTTAGATVESYTRFIRALRALLASGEVSHGIPVMRERSTVPDSQRFVLVELSNSAAGSPVTLAVDVTNAYVVAYRTGRRSFLLPEAIHNPFPGTEPPDTLSFSGNYRDLQKCGGNDRNTIHLGMEPLDNAITALRNSNMKQQRPMARSLIVVIQMVAEAARFGYIKDLVCKNIDGVFKPDFVMLRLENKWKALSKAIQRSNEEGFFTTGPVILHDVSVGSVRDSSERTGIAIMLFVPLEDGQPSPLLSSNPTKGGPSRAALVTEEESSLRTRIRPSPTNGQPYPLLSSNPTKGESSRARSVMKRSPPPRISKGECSSHSTLGENGAISDDYPILETGEESAKKTKTKKK